MKWSKELTNKLIELYPDTPNYELIKIFNTTEKTITSKAYKLGLKKSKECKSFLIGKRNKMVGRDLNYENVKEIASKYKSRGEFQYSDSSAYRAARVNGWLNNVCSHMTIINFSIPQLILKNIMDKLLNLESLYETRQVIKPYEIDIYYPQLKLGFEYQGKLWHNKEYNNNRDLYKNKLAKELGITLIHIIENNRKYEQDIKNQIIDKLSIINEFTTIKINKEDVLNCVVTNPYLKLYNKDELINITKTYTSFKIFIKSEKKIYSKLRRLDLLDEATKHMTDRRLRRNETEVKEKIKKYTTLGDLIKNDYGTYIFIKKNKLEKLISHLKSRFNK